jgi:hypothetical protein
MENNQSQTPMTQEQMIAEIHKFTKQTRNYMRWQMYITIILVVIPLLASLFILPFAIGSLEKTYIAPLQGMQ